MINTTSSFLQGVIAANVSTSGATSASPPADEGAVLAAIKRDDVNDIASLAAQLETGPTKVQPTVDALAEEGLVENDGNTLRLSEAGERALRYMNISNS
jgi:DNA-binding IclR family transcriptional regulator